MNFPPICNYEGSDYQTTFWNEGCRAYEDAVEAVALQRLLPGRGRIMLELGAGAGRNTPRYQGFDKIVLLDYSRTQLEQAQQRLGIGERYVYVAADVYRLPFVDGLFDGATMIRTLHHMADGQRALEQVRRVLQTNTTFILEYANKQNLKAILRYLMHRQGWNPFSPEPVEFAAINYNFHPAAVRGWLQDCGFIIEKQLTISHLRIGLLKRIVPLRILVSLDALFQWTGALWQLTPSVFVRCRARGNTPSAGPGEFFCCPACGAGPITDTPPELTCRKCRRTYPVTGGIYDFRLT